MNSRDGAILASVIILAAVAAAVWFMPDVLTGDATQKPLGEWANPWDSVNSTQATLSCQKWLATDMGVKAFGNASAGEAVPVFDDNRSLMLWIIPVKDSEGFYIGYIQTSGEDFKPVFSLKYQEPRTSFIGRGFSDDVYAAFMLKYVNKYSEEQIKSPYIVTKSNGGYYWASEVTENGKVIDKVFMQMLI